MAQSTIGKTEGQQLSPEREDSRKDGRGTLSQRLGRVIRTVSDSPGLQSLKNALRGGPLLVNEPPCEISERDGNYMIQMDLPGLNGDEIRIDASEHRIIISGERRPAGSNPSRGRQFGEPRYGHFEKVFDSPWALDVGRIRAKYEHGVLELKIPRAQPERFHSVSVSTSSSSAPLAPLVEVSEPGKGKTEVA